MGACASQAAAQQAKPNEVGELVVTGSLIRGLPKEYVASPVFTHGKEDLVRSGAGSVSEYILTIPQNFTGDISEFATTGAGIGTPLGEGTTYNQFDGFAGFALRGLASDATLTLLNGRRMASVGMIEAPTVSVIPSALIERIDIIPDGASATYGADAVAGVVNIVTRRPRQGAEVRLRAGAATETGKRDYEASVLGGHAWNGGSVYGMAMYQKRSPFVGGPLQAQGETLQITQLPDERLSNLSGGLEQTFGDFTLTIDAFRFQRDRSSRQLFLDEPQYNRLFKTRTTGVSIYNGLNWRGDGATSLDFTVDYHRNQTDNSSTTGTRRPNTRAYTNKLFVAELRGQTAVATLPAGPVMAAGGVQYREETLRTDATIFFNRNGGERKVTSVFGEVNAPLIGPEQEIPFVRALTLSAAARYEDLGFDKAWAPKVGVRWQIDPSLALRATYARSFLVPRFRDTIGIAEQVSLWAHSDAFLNPADQDPRLPPGVSLVMFRAGANPDLKTQNADTLTVGVDWTPAAIPNLTVRAGYYRIEIKDRVGSSSPEDILAVKDLQVFNIRRPSLEQMRKVLENPAVFRRFATEIPFVAGGETIFFDNAAAVPADLLAGVNVIADIRTQNFAVEATDGFDLDLAYSTDLFGGRANLHLTGQYILDLSLKAGGESPVSRLDGYGKPAKLRLNGSVVWGRGGVSAGSVINYVDGFTDDRPGMPRRKIDAFTTASLFVGFDLGRLSAQPWLADSELQLVAANVFNRQPPRIVDGVVGYDPYNNPPAPRTLSVVLTKRFGGG